MTIGDIMAALRTAAPEASVAFDFACCIPTTVDSWRGVYAEPAIGWEAGGRVGGKEVHAPTLLAELEQAIGGRTYNGWKGGAYQYDRDSPLHVDNPGEYTSTEIVRVEVRRLEVILHTERDK